jgi:hypothetical protein
MNKVNFKSKQYQVEIHTANLFKKVHIVSFWINTILSFYCFIMPNILDCLFEIKTQLVHSPLTMGTLVAKSHKLWQKIPFTIISLSLPVVAEYKVENKS